MRQRCWLGWWGACSGREPLHDTAALGRGLGVRPHGAQTPAGACPAVCRLRVHSADGRQQPTFAVLASDGSVRTIAAPSSRRPLAGARVALEARISVLIPIMSSGNLDALTEDGQAERPAALIPALSAVLSVVSFGNHNPLKKLGRAGCPKILNFGQRRMSRTVRFPPIAEQQATGRSSSHSSAIARDQRTGRARPATKGLATISCPEFLDAPPIDFQAESRGLRQMHHANPDLHPTAVNRVAQRMPPRIAMRFSNKRRIPERRHQMQVQMLHRMRRDRHALLFGFMRDPPRFSEPPCHMESNCTSRIAAGSMKSRTA